MQAADFRRHACRVDFFAMRSAANENSPTRAKAEKIFFGKSAALPSACVSVRVESAQKVAKRDAKTVAFLRRRPPAKRKLFTFYPFVARVKSFDLSVARFYAIFCRFCKTNANLLAYNPITAGCLPEQPPDDAFFDAFWPKNAVFQSIFSERKAKLSLC